MTVQYAIGKQFSNSRKEMILHDTEILSHQAAFTCDLIKQLGIIACVHDGEDSSGRQKLRIATPQEVVDRATQIADLAFKDFANRGWIVNGPDIKEIWDTGKKDDE